MGILSTGSVTLVDLTDQRPFQFYLETQGSRVQSKDGDGTYQPDYTKTSITIKPKLFFGNDDGTEHITSDTISYTINGVVVDSGDTIGYKNGINCVINKNIPSDSKVQLIEATLETKNLKDPKTDVKINNGELLKASIELVLNTQGLPGLPGLPGPPGVKGDSMISRVAYWIKSSISPEPPDSETGDMKGWTKGNEPPESALDGIETSDKFWRIYKETYSNGESEYIKYSEVELIGSYEVLNGLVQFRNGVTTIENGITVIDGGKIHTKSIKADRIRVEDLEALKATIGGFHIGKNSIYSGTKQTIDSIERGIYFDSNGQSYFGDDKNFIRFYQSDNDNYKLQISADSLTFGSGISVEKSFEDVKKNIQNAQTAIDNFEVGGRNLLINSSFSQNLDEWTLNADVTNEFITDGKHDCIHITMDTLNIKRLISQDVLSRVDVDTEYTLSGWFKVANLVKGSSPKIMLYTELGDSYVSYGRAEITEETDWQRLKLTFTTDSNLSNATSFRIFVYLNDITADVYFCNLKLERGNKVTDWTPSTEEIDDIGDSVIKLESSIEQTAGAVVNDALSDYVRNEDVENEDGTVTEGFNSIIEALRAAITAADGRVTTEVANRTTANDGIQQQITEIRNRMDFDESGLIFKSFVDGVESPYRIKITNDEMIFYNGTTEVQRFDAQGNAKIPSLVIDNSMRLGGFALTTDSRGNLNLDWIGGN